MPRNAANIEKEYNPENQPNSKFGVLLVNHGRDEIIHADPSALRLLGISPLKVMANFTVSAISEAAKLASGHSPIPDNTPKEDQNFATQLPLMEVNGKSISVFTTQVREDEEHIATVYTVQAVPVIPIEAGTKTQEEQFIEDSTKRGHATLEGLAKIAPHVFQITESEESQVLETEGTLDPVTLYRKEAGRTPLLTQSQEVELAVAIEAGQLAQAELLKDPNTSSERQRTLTSRIKAAEKANKHLLEANLRLVMSIAKRYMGRGLTFSDLTQEGNLGLMRAAEKYDYAQGNKFSTYATWWIRQSISRAIADQGRSVRIPVHMHDKITKVMRTAREQEQFLNREPTAAEIASEINMEPEEVEDIFQASKIPTSLDTFVNDEEDTQLGDLVVDPTQNTAETASKNTLRESFEAVLDEALNPRERRVLALRFGLDDGRIRTLAETGEEVGGITRERIRQIEQNALRKLRHKKYRQKLAGLLD